MSVGRNLQEMENVVTKGAVAAEPMQKLATGIAPGQTGSWEDLGGPTPDNYRPDDDSAKLSTPGATLKSVKNVVNKGAAPAQAVAKEESEYDDEVVAEAAEEEEKEKGKDEGGKHKEGKHKKGKEEPGEGADEEDDEDGMKKEEFDIEEDINALIAGEELSEEFQEKARTIFEAAIKTKVAEIKEQLESAYEEQLQGMKGLFEDHYVTIPEERYDVIENMVDKLDEMETKLNEQIEKNIALNKRLAESVTDVIFAEVSEGLALSQKDKLASLAENVEFDGEANYREKLVTLRNSYFSPTAGAQRNISENLSEEVDSDVNTPVISEGLMNSYLQTLQRVSKK